MAPSLYVLGSDSYNIDFNNIQHQSSNSTTVPSLNPDQSTNAPSLLAINGALMAFTTLVVLARFYVRAVILKSIGSDDWLIAIAAGCGIGTFVCFYGETTHGLGMHSDAIST